MAHAVPVEEVSGGKALTRFVELPHALAGRDPRFAPLVLAWERYRIDPRRNPYLDEGEAALFLARRAGRPAGRIAAHVAAPGGAGAFGLWWVDDDLDVAAALVATAERWLAEQGATSMTGPWSFTPDQEAGVQVAGHDGGGLTGRPWHPPHLARLLEQLGFETVEDRPTWRLAATELGPGPAPDGDAPGQAGAYADERLALPGIAAVPDVSDALRARGPRGAVLLARRARARAWETCTVVRCTTEPAVAVPALQAAAGRAGYRWVVAPWTPDPAAEPEAIHRIYRRRVQRL